jgi:hypothetical protein
MNLTSFKLRVLAFGALGLMALAPVSGALADHIQESNANPRASCMAHEASAVSPPSNEGDHTASMPEELAFWDSVIPILGLKNRGSVAKALATLHLPGHAECDAAFGLHD